ncbi:ATP-binding protein [Streptomyces sp. NPDC007088]|uniref:ATP-binding protein n=1 Tax=Streptomyces sp. NPDC007088 TaxID=3364773 RepID=UPI003683B508
MSIWWSLHLRREAASVPLARRLLSGAMDTAGVDADTAFDLSLALTEACANAVEHGGGTSDTQAGKYRVTVRLDGERCRVEVTDSGPGFPALRGRAPRRQRLEAEDGRGLGIITELADHAQFRNRTGRGGAVVSFDKIVKWRTDAPLLV